MRTYILLIAGCLSAAVSMAQHPSYKNVMLRLMPLTTGGGPRVIASLYGGQGTLNAV